MSIGATTIPYGSLAVICFLMAMMCQFASLACWLEGRECRLPVARRPLKDVEQWKRRLRHRQTLFQACAITVAAAALLLLRHASIR